MLHQVIAPVEEPVHGSSSRAGYVSGQAMQLHAPHFFDGTADERAIGQLYVGINEQHIARDRQPRAVIPARGRQSARNYLDIEPAGKAAGDFRRAVSRAGVSQVHLRILHLRVVLLRQRGQQFRQQARLVLRRNDYGQFARRIHIRGFALLPCQS